MSLSPRHPGTARQTIPSIWRELRRHVPFTLFGTLTGVAIAIVLIALRLPHPWVVGLFWGLHPLHVLLSALATTSLYRHWAKAGWLRCFIIGYLGSVGIATLSDSVIPYVGEWMIDLPNRGIHIGFIEKWWLVNPLAILGIGIAWLLPTSTVPHAGHVLLSTWASMFHMQMALGDSISLSAILVMPIFLFLAVWIPCCTSDIVLPVFFGRMAADRQSVGQSRRLKHHEGERAS